MKNLILTLSLFLLTLTGYSQKNTEKKAYYMFNNQKHDIALQLFLELDSKSQNPIKYDYLIGMCYLTENNPNTSLAYLRTGKDYEETSWVVNYYLGMAYFLVGNDVEAINYLTIYKDKLISEKIQFKRVNLDKIPQKYIIHYTKNVEYVDDIINQCQASIKSDYAGMSK